MVEVAEVEGDVGAMMDVDDGGECSKATSFLLYLRIVPGCAMVSTKKR